VRRLTEYLSDFSFRNGYKNIKIVFQFTFSFSRLETPQKASIITPILQIYIKAYLAEVSG
jgi:hypothetical protein